MKMVRIWMLLLVCVFLLPVNVMAAGNAASVTVNGITTEYVTFALAREAFNKATTPATLTLLKNYTEKKQSIEIGGDVEKILDLNGYTLTYSNSMSFPVVVNKCPLTVIGGGKIVHASNARTGIKVSTATYREILAIRRIL